MFLWGDFHTHTIYSHGSGSIEDNVKEAVKKGLLAVGISEHGPANMGIGMKIEDYAKMRDEIEKLKEIYEINILLGCEANVISTCGKLDIPDKLIEELDYVMVGLHPLVWPLSLSDGYHLVVKNIIAKKINPCLKSQVKMQNTAILINVLNNYKVDAITHPGLHLPIDTAELAKSAAKVGTALEINSGHGFMTEEFVRIAKNHGARFIIGSDAHHPNRVGDFSRAVQIAQKAGLTKKDIINAS
ncbi:MAG: PHP domain-containing protein [Tepidanaerobacteraceae bacterium]|jgi:putative hydrolase